MRILIDEDRCIASGACVLACPEVFAQDEAGIVFVLDEEPPAEYHEKVLAAVRACPATVISTAE